MKQVTLLVILFSVAFAVSAQDIKNNPGSNHGNRFEQIGEPFFPHPTNTVPQVVHPDQSTGSNVVIMILPANWMNSTAV